MARRRKDNGLNVFVELLALLPWWLCLVLGVAGYFVFDHLSAPLKTAAIPAGSDPFKMLHTVMVGSVMLGVSLVLKFLAPAVCAVAAIASFLARSKRRRLLVEAQDMAAVSPASGMTWREFEMLVGEAYRRQGYSVYETSPGPDGGVDLVMTKGGEKYLVQCKHWRAFKVGVPVVRELYGAMAARGAAGAMVVTSGTFTGEAKAFAQGRNITLVDGRALNKLIQSAREPLPQGRGVEPVPVAEPPMVLAPVCPKCGAGMAKRQAKRGANAGQYFWGCTNYPGCRGTVQMER